MARNIDPSELEFGDQIGDGASADVFLGKWRSKEVAIKKFKTSVRSTMRTDYQNEVKLLANLNHENIVKVFGYCDKIGNTFIVCEYMEGGALDGYIQSRTSMKWSNAFPIIKGIVDGMTYLHDRQILHLDLKSPNILLDESKKTAKINDFGIAKLTTLTSTTTARVTVTSSRTNSAKGTTRWMAPEISQGKDASRRSDVWSFGCILIEFAIRNYPFPNLQDSAIFSFLQNKNAEIPINIPAQTPTLIASLIEKCLNRNRTERPTFDAIKNILQQISSSDLNKTIDSQSSMGVNTVTNVTTLKTVLDNIKTVNANTKTNQENAELKNELKSLREQLNRMEIQQSRPSSSRQPVVYPIEVPCPQPVVYPIEVPCRQPVYNSQPYRVPSAAPAAVNYQSTGERYVSNGSANGREIFEGARGGRFYLTESGNKRYL